MPPTTSSTASTPPVLVLAASASAAAGVVHAAAAGSHAGLTVLASLYGVVALLQIGWGVALLRRPTNGVVLAGVGLQLVALGTWAASRTTGVAFVEGLEAAQPVGTQDGLVAALQLVAVVGGLVALTSFRPGRLLSRAAPVFAAAMLVAAVPAMATPHDAGHHGTDDGHHADAGHDDDGHHGDDGHHEVEPADPPATPTAGVSPAPVAASPTDPVEPIEPTEAEVPDHPHAPDAAPHSHEEG